MMLSCSLYHTIAHDDLAPPERPMGNRGKAVAWLMRLKKKKCHHNINMQGKDANPVLRYLELRAGSLATLAKITDDSRHTEKKIVR